MKFIDHTDKTFGRLTATGYFRGPSGLYKWSCKCECGKETIVDGWNLRSGHTQSCGCLQRESTMAAKEASTTHGMSYTSEYKIWQNMHQRCGNEKHKSFADYGGRGIQVCKEWKNFDGFFADMGLRPTLKHSIDRIDNDGNYEPDNVRWATHRDQNANKRENLVVRAFGRVAPLAAFFSAGSKSIEYKRARQRIKRNNWEAERAISEARP